MKKKILAMCLVVALAATAIAGATLAFFTDTDKADNTFTTGTVKIQLVEEQRNGEGREEFVQDQKIYPYTGVAGDKDQAKNYVDKIVNVKRLGSEAAYVRVLVAVPAELKNVLHIDWNSDAWTQATAPQVTINGTLHDVYVMTYNTALLKKNEFTKDQAMFGFYLDSAVDYNNKDGGYTLNGELINYDLSRLTIPVFAQGIQAQGFESAEAAFTAAKLTTDPWFVPQA